MNRLTSIAQILVIDMPRLLALLLLFLFSGQARAVEKIIIDTDLSHYSDDHEALVMLASLHRQRQVELLGVTLVTGNDWLAQMEIDTLKALERLELENEVPVYLGAEKPLMHSREKFERHDRELYGAIYAGAWDRDKQVQPPPDGAPQRAQAQPMHAVDFIIETVRGNPGEITIAALGPLTNLALALHKAPDIVAGIGRIIYMGGAFFVWGNVTSAAEFNWWFDAEAAQMVLSEPIRHIIIPLDATDRILFDESLYRRFTSAKYTDHFMVAGFLAPKFGQKMKENPDYRLPVWDALVAAWIAQPELVLERDEYWVSIDTSQGPGYGRSLAAPVATDAGFMKPFRPFSSQRAEVILKLDEKKFWQVYEQLLFAQ